MSGTVLQTPQDDEAFQDKVGVQSANRLLNILSPDDLSLLAPAFERVPLQLGELLIEAHKPIKHAYFIENGLISIIADATRREGGRIEIGIVGREGFVGTPIFLGADQSPHIGLVQAGGHALRISAADLQIALHKSPAIRGVLGRFVQSLIIQVGHTVYANADLKIEGRLARWLLMAQDRLEREDLPFTHEFLSLMLGVRRPGVTMALQALEGGRMIRAKRGHIMITDRGKLLDFIGDAYGQPEVEYERLLSRA